LLPTTSGNSVAANAKVGQSFGVNLPQQPKGTSITYSFIGPNKKMITLVSTTLKSTGKINLPMLAFKTPGKYTLQIKIGKIIKNITITVKK